MRKPLIALAAVVLVLATAPTAGAAHHGRATRAEYNRVKYHMTAAQVARIFGTRGQLVTKQDTPMVDIGESPGLVPSADVGAQMERRYYVGKRLGHPCWGYHIMYTKQVNRWLVVSKGDWSHQNCSSGGRGADNQPVPR